MFNINNLTKHSTKIFLLIFFVIITLFYFQSLSNWWFEDDPLQYFYVSQITNPLDIFINAETMHNFSKAFVPMQILSYWFDVKLFGFSPFAAYLHSLISLISTFVLLYFVIKRWTQNNLLAMAIPLIWLLLPSTVVVFRFIATRHYLEGLFFALLTAYFVHKYLENREKPNNLLIIPIVIFAITAMLFKEIYATSMIVFLLSLGIWNKEKYLVGGSVFITIFYAAYRIWGLGTDITYTMPFLGVVEYLRYLVGQSYTLTSNKGAYLIYIGLALLSGVYIKKEKSPGIYNFVFFLLLLCSVLIAIYPVAYAVLMTYKIPGTWYRVPFIVNTILVIWGVFMLSKTVNSKRFILVLCLILLVVIPGTWQTRKYWNERMTRSEMEGKFYLENPDKLLLSEEDANWFIVGVHKMHNIPNKHFINKNEIVGEHSKEMISNFPIIWRYQDGEFIPDEKLFMEIKQQNENK